MIVRTRQEKPDVSEPKGDVTLKDVAEQVLQERMRIERAVDAGLLPARVLESCERWEKAAMGYGALLARQAATRPPVVMPTSATVH